MEDQVINDEWVKQHFTMRTSDMYELPINLPVVGEGRKIIADKMEKRWIAYYQVGATTASSTKHTINEVKKLYQTLTGKEL